MVMHNPSTQMLYKNSKPCHKSPMTPIPTTHTKVKQAEAKSVDRNPCASSLAISMRPGQNHSETNKNQAIQNSRAKHEKNEWFDRLIKGIENKGDRAITECEMSKQGGNRGLSYTRRRQGPSGRKNKVCRKTEIEISKHPV